MQIRLKAYYLLLWGCLLLTMSGCASVNWEARIDKDAELAWPPPPNPTKATYLGSLKAFTQDGKSLLNILFGLSDSGRIHRPVAMCVGGDGRIAVADAKRQGVHLYIPKTRKYRFLRKMAKEMFESPVSLVFDNDMQLFVADSMLRKVLIFDEQGNFTGEITSAGRNPFLRPTGLAYQERDGLLYVADTKAHRVSIFADDGEFRGNFGRPGMGDGEFNMPTHITTFFKGNVFVNDAMNFRIQEFTGAGSFLGDFGHHGNGSGDFAMSKGVAVDRWGVVYVVDTLFDRVQLFNNKGDYLMDIGARGTDPGQFWLPSGLFVDRNNVLYVCDTYNGRIQLFQLAHFGSEGRIQ